MLTYEDCLEFCELSEDEVDAIANHENVPDMIAVELGNYLVHSAAGEPAICHMIMDDIREARAGGHRARAAKLELVLTHFVASHHRQSV